MHAFLQERSQKYFQNELLASKRQTISLAGSVLRGRAQKDVFEAAIFEQKKTFKKMTAEVPEIKLVNRKKHTDEATLCSSNIYCLWQKWNSITTTKVYLI